MVTTPSIRLLTSFVGQETITVNLPTQFDTETYKPISGIRKTLNVFVMVVGMDFLGRDRVEKRESIHQKHGEIFHSWHSCPYVDSINDNIEILILSHKNLLIYLLTQFHFLRYHTGSTKRHIWMHSELRKWIYYMIRNKNFTNHFPIFFPNFFIWRFTNIIH